MSRLTVAPKAARAFQRAAWRAYPREYVAAAYGRVDKLTEDVQVVAFGAVPHRAKRQECTFTPEDIVECRRKAVGTGVYYLGTLHTHPDADTCEPSEHDWDTAAQYDDWLMGICALWTMKGRRHSRMRFYRAHTPYVAGGRKED